MVVDHLRRVLAQQAGLVDRDPGLRDVLLDRSLLDERLAERHAVLRAGDHERERPLRRAQCAHAVVDAAGTQPGLGQGEAGALLTQQVRGRDADVLEDDLGVPVLVVLTHDRQIADDPHARRVRGDEDHRLLTVRLCRRVRLAHDDEDPAARVQRTGGPPLAAVDDVLVALAGDRRLDVRRIGAGDLGLRHRERGSDLAVQQRLQPLGPLLLRREHVQQLHVAGVRRLPVRGLRCQVEAPPGDLCEARVVQLAEAGLRRQEQVPQAAGLGLRLELLDDRRHGVVVRAVLSAVRLVLGLRREDALVHEGDERLAQLEGLRGRAQVQ